MAGGSTSEEMDAVDPWGDVTPDRPVSIYDLDEDLPTRAQSSEEIAEYQQMLRDKKRAAAYRSFPPPRDTPSVRPVPRESGPVRIDRLRVPPPMPEREAPPDAHDGDLEQVLSDVAATLERLPPAPRLPVFEQPRGSLEVIRTSPEPPPAIRPPPRWRRAAIVTLSLVLIALVAAALAVFLR